MQSHPAIVSPLNGYNYIHTGKALTYIHTQGRFDNQTAHSLYGIQVTAASVITVMKIESIAPRAGFKPTLLVNPVLVC